MHLLCHILTKFCTIFGSGFDKVIREREHRELLHIISRTPETTTSNSFLGFSVWSSLVKIFEGSSRIFEDLHVDLCEDLDQDL